MKSIPSIRHAFSLVEVLAAIAIIGIITFLALPNIVRVKEDSERTLAIARAEALNMAIASYIQANGQAAAAATWTSAGSPAARYLLVAQHLAFAPATLDDYMPGGYTVTPPTSLAPPLQQSALAGPHGGISY